MSKQKKLIILFVIAGLAFCLGRYSAPKAPQRPVITKVIDGDTVIIDGLGICRLVGIDTPELRKKINGEWVKIRKPDYGAEESRDWLRQFVGKEVRAVTRGFDKYNRRLIELYLPDGSNAATEMKARGWQKKRP